MLEKLVEIIETWWESIWPITIIPCYEDGVLLRLGEYKRTLKGGSWYVKIPLADTILVQSNTLTTSILNSQTLITADNKQVVACAVVKYKIKNVKPFLLELAEPDDVLVDVTMGTIRDVIRSLDLSELDACEKIIIDQVRLEMNKYGFSIKKITFTDLAPIKTIRLLHEGNRSE